MTPRAAMARALAAADDFTAVEEWEDSPGQLEWGDKVTGQLRADGYLLVSEADLAAALHEADCSNLYCRHAEVTAKTWAALGAARAASQPSEDGPADEGAEPVHEHGPLSWHETPNLMAWRCDVCGTFPVDIHS